MQLYRHSSSAKVSAPAGAGERARCAFTLMEMVVVVGIIGILAALALPSLKMGKGNSMSSAARQLMDDLSLARLRAISSRSSVFVVFFPGPNYIFAQNNGGSSTFFGIPAADANFFTTNIAANSLLGGQFSSYALFSTHSVGDQPGQNNLRYTTEWKSLPDGIFISTNAFKDSTVFRNVTNSWNTTIWFPVPTAVGTLNVDYVNYGLPYIEFDSQGRLKNPFDVEIPLTVGSVFAFKDPTGETNLVQDVDFVETPPGNSVSNPNKIHIYWVTGRNKLIRQELP